MHRFLALLPFLFLDLLPFAAALTGPANATSPPVLNVEGDVRRVNLSK